MATEPATVAAEAAIKPGIYPGLSFAEYHAIAAVNHSTLEPFKRTPAHAREEMLHPKDQTADLAIGHAFHVCLLEPERFELEYTTPPKISRRSKLGKATWRAWEDEHPGVFLIDADELKDYEAMRASVLAHPTAGELLKGAIAKELTIVWQDEATGQLCKARLDIVTGMAGWSFVIDLKTSRDASERWFQRDVSTYGYYRQLAWYRKGLRTLRPAERRAGIVAVEKEPPFAVACYELDERALEQGEREMAHYLDQYRRCMETGVWPAYDAGLSLIDLPPWAVDKLDLSE